jgi:hypothetical protein
VRNLVNPPDDYRLTVLAGLDPMTILECTQRAMAFWTYQNTQEQSVAILKVAHVAADRHLSSFQQHTARHWSNRLQALRTESDRIVLDANTRLEDLERQVRGMTRLALST